MLSYDKNYTNISNISNIKFDISTLKLFDKTKTLEKRLPCARDDSKPTYKAFIWNILPCKPQRAAHHGATVR